MEVRLLIFVISLVLLIGLEYLWPRRKRWIARNQRWPINFLLTLLNTGLSLAAVSLSSVAIAEVATLFELGLLPESGITGPLAVVITVLVLDVTIYWQHRLFHVVPFLWRFHRVHHADPDLDVTSGFRFHPIEIILSLMIKLAVITLLGAHPIGVLLFEIALSSGSLFNHTNMNIRGRLDWFLRLFVVTPDMHRIHHSPNPLETNSNYSFTISVWDRIFGSYRGESLEPQETMVIGLEGLSDDKAHSIWQMLCYPFESHHK